MDVFRSSPVELITEFIDKHSLPPAFRRVAEHYYVPLCNDLQSVITDKKTASKAPLVLGINGAQGTGKSTLADFIADFFVTSFDLYVAVVSIDDFYLTKSDRLTLSEEVHPLLKTRGVPGTHDLDLAINVLQQLVDGQSQVALPRFDKSVDDRRPSRDWPVTTQAVDLVIMEGWCVGSLPEPESALEVAVNELETNQDKDGIWRRYVQHCLAGDYQRLFAFLDALVLLKAPDFDSVYRWRLEQESKLAEKVGFDAPGLMNEAQIKAFIQHYERLTRQNLKALPDKADWVLELNQEHQVVSSFRR